MSNRDDDVSDDDFVDRKKVRANRRKDKKFDRPSGDKRIKKVGSDSRWRYDPRKLNGDDNDYEEEDIE